MNEAFTVSQLNGYIKDLISEDICLNDIQINGEISNFVNHVRSGHFYFSVKDSYSSLKCVMFKNNASRLKFLPENGMNVTLRGSIGVFERDGVYQLYCTDMSDGGVGQLYAEFEKKKAELEKKGLFNPEHKKPIPAFPSRIGIITSKTGAALQDILNVLRRRFPIAHALVIPCLVQGAEAPDSVCEAFDHAEKLSLDVIILARGGGSIEDLWAFNSEKIAFKIFASPIPVITGIGHEIDFTIADFTADLRAPTPTAAAELAVPDIIEIKRRLEFLSNRIREKLYSEQEYRFKYLFDIEKRLGLLSPDNYVRNNIILLENMKKRLRFSIGSNKSRYEQYYCSLLERLEALNPMSVLKRGYSFVKDENGTVVTDVNMVSVGQNIISGFNNGEIVSKVSAIKTKND